MLSLSSRAEENVVPFVTTQCASRLSRRSRETAVARIASSSTSHRFVVANMLPMSLLKTAQGHPMEDFCHPRSQVLTRSSLTSDMDSGDSRMGIDSGECLNVIFEVIDKVQEETVKWSDCRPTVGGQGRGKGRKMIRLPRRYRGWGKRKCTWIRRSGGGKESGAHCARVSLSGLSKVFIAVAWTTLSFLFLSSAIGSHTESALLVPVPCSPKVMHSKETNSCMNQGKVAGALTVKSVLLCTCFISPSAIKATLGTPRSRWLPSMETSGCSSGLGLKLIICNPVFKDKFLSDLFSTI